MTDARDRIRAQMQSLEEELARIPPHSWNHGRIADRRQGLILCQMQLDRIDRMHQRFLDYRATLVARHHAFAARKGGR
jgi:hypothetical protein